MEPNSGCMPNVALLLAPLMVLLAPFLLFFGIDSQDIALPMPFEQAETASSAPMPNVVEVVPSDPADLAVYVYSTLVNARRFEEAERYLCQSDINDMSTITASNIVFENMQCRAASDSLLECTTDAYSNGVQVAIAQGFQIEYANGIFCTLD